MYIVIGKANGADDRWVGTFSSWDAAQDWIDRAKQADVHQLWAYRVATLAGP